MNYKYLIQEGASDLLDHNAVVLVGQPKLKLKIYIRFPYLEW